MAQVVPQHKKHNNMGIQIITDQHFELISKLFDGVKKSVMIISPFVKMGMANILCDKLSDNSDISVTLITRFYRNDFVLGVSDLRALEKLVE